MRSTPSSPTDTVGLTLTYVCLTTLRYSLQANDQTFLSRGYLVVSVHGPARATYACYDGRERDRKRQLVSNRLSSAGRMCDGFRVLVMARIEEELVLGVMRMGFCLVADGMGGHGTQYVERSHPAVCHFIMGYWHDRSSFPCCLTIYLYNHKMEDTPLDSIDP